MNVRVCRNYRRNLLSGGLLCLLIYSEAALAQHLSVLNGVTMPFFGVPLTVLAMATAGALIGAGYTDPVESRKKLYTLTIANTLFAAWFVVLIPEWQGWTLSEVAKPPLAGVIAAANCVLIPALFKRLPDAASGILDRVFNRPSNR